MTLDLWSVYSKYVSVRHGAKNGSRCVIKTFNKQLCNGTLYSHLKQSSSVCSNMRTMKGAYWVKTETEQYIVMLPFFWGGYIQVFNNSNITARQAYWTKAKAFSPHCLFFFVYLLRLCVLFLHNVHTLILFFKTVSCRPSWSWTCYVAELLIVLSFPSNTHYLLNINATSKISHRRRWRSLSCILL